MVKQQQHKNKTIKPGSPGSGLWGCHCITDKKTHGGKYSVLNLDKSQGKLRLNRSGQPLNTEGRTGPTGVGLCHTAPRHSRLELLPKLVKPLLSDRVTNIAHERLVKPGVMQ